MAAHMRTSLVTAALDMAIAARKPPAGVISVWCGEVGTGSFDGRVTIVGSVSGDG